MENQGMPVMNKKQLVKSVIIAIVIGGLVLVTAVLPAEYNIDPLGTGKLFGFSSLYVEPPTTTEIKVANSETPSPRKTLKIAKLGSPPSVSKPAEANNPPPEEQLPVRADTITVVIPARKGIEYKFKALKYASIKYDWKTTNNKEVYIDFHGEVQQENPPENVFYESYILAYSANMAGTFTTPFKGRHGWYFRNETQTDIQITLHLDGQYELLE